MKYVLVALASLLLLAACGGDTGDDQLPPPPTTDADDVIRDIQEKSQEQTALEEYLSKGKNRGFSVTYDTMDSFAGKSGELAMYVKGDNARTDVTMEVEGDRIEARQYQLAGELISCDKQETWSCMIMDFGDDAGNTPLDMQSSFEEPDVDVTKKASRTIAGATAECFLVEFGDGMFGDMSTEQCFSEEGVLLYSEMIMPQGTIKWEATEYSLSVSDSDFEPPAEPQTMEDFLAGMMGDMPT